MIISIFKMHLKGLMIVKYTYINIFNYNGICIGK